MALAVVAIAFIAFVAIVNVANAYHRRKYWRERVISDDPHEIERQAKVAAEYEAAKRAMENAQRPYWKPDFGNDAPDGERSRFGGEPDLDDGHWPHCVHCVERMSFFLQLCSNELPAPSPFGDGILQLFRCLNETCDTRSTLLRVISLAAQRSDTVERVINGWDQYTTDFPSPFDYAAAGIDVSDEIRNDLAEMFDTHEGDKFLGWPYWPDRAESVSCSRCGAQMRVILQIEITRGDLETRHIAVCPNHPHELAFIGHPFLVVA
jgi:hypothetical protein